MTRLASRLRAALALSTAAALVVLSPGLEAPRLFAQAVGRSAPVEGVSPVAGLSAAAPSTALSAFSPASLAAAPALAAPSSFAGAEVPAAVQAAAAVAAPAARAASVPEMAQSLAPQLEAAAKPETSDSGASAAGRGIEDVITGGRSAGSGGISDVAGVLGSGAPALALRAAASTQVESVKASVPAVAAPASGKIVDSAVSYRVHRFLLNAVAALTGGLYSLPVAGPALTRKLIESAADKNVVFSDFDSTLADYNQILPAEMTAAVDAIKAAGKTFVVISDRGDEPRKGQLTVFESLASLSVATRAGMYVAANSGGRVYRYDDKGEPVRVFEAPAPDAAEKAKLVEAVDATKARLKDIGAELHYPSATNKVPTESWNVYSYAMMLKIGSDDAHVRGAAAILTEEMKKRGYVVQVDPRYAKDPTNPPYVVFSLVTKQTSAGFIANALKAGPGDVLVIGDSMYTPNPPRRESWLTRLGVKLSGVALPRTGNRGDRNMELGVPGALTLSVGASGDAGASNLFVLSGKGPSVTLQVLKSVASKPRTAPPAGDGKYLANPNVMYGEALKKAVEIAAARGVAAGQVLFVGATASMPVRDGAHWHYTFSIPGKDGARALIYADTSRFLGGGFETRTSVYENAPAQAGLAKALDPVRVFYGTMLIDPQQALDAARRAEPGLGGGVSVSFDYREEPVSGQGDLWYRFHGDNGGAVSINARTAETRVGG
jgi:hydroxymethylpyrimidine pyrophosphatase-like HAD family hydrolase